MAAGRRPAERDRTAGERGTAEHIDRVAGGTVGAFASDALWRMQSAASPGPPIRGFETVRSKTSAPDEGLLEAETLRDLVDVQSSFRDTHHQAEGVIVAKPDHITVDVEHHHGSEPAQPLVAVNERVVDEYAVLRRAPSIAIEVDGASTFPIPSDPVSRCVSMIIDIREAPTRLAELVRRTEAGEAIVIARDGRPIARLVPYTDQPTIRVPGRLRGRIHIAEDFDATSEALVEAFGPGWE